MNAHKTILDKNVQLTNNHSAIYLRDLCHHLFICHCLIVFAYIYSLFLFFCLAVFCCFASILNVINCLWNGKSCTVEACITCSAHQPTSSSNHSRKCSYLLSISSFTATRLHSIWCLSDYFDNFYALNKPKNQ